MINVIYDCDDVLNNLCEYCTSKIGIDSTLIKYFDITKNTGLTKKEQDSMLKMFRDPEVFRNLTYVNGAKDILKVEKLGNVNVRINSNNFNTDVAAVKTETLLEHIDGITLDKIHMQVGTTHSKEPLDDTDIIIEDCLMNLRKYPKKTFRILINCYHNQSEVYDTTDEIEGIHRVANLVEANKLVENTVKKMLAENKD